MTQTTSSACPKRDAPNPFSNRLYHRVLNPRCVQGFQVKNPTARNRLFNELLNRGVAAAIVMPYDAFYDVATKTRYDIDRIAAFGVTFEQVAHRLTTLQSRANRAFHFS